MKIESQSRSRSSSAQHLAVSLFASLAAAGLLTGCGLDSSKSKVGPPVTISAVQTNGMVMGGQQPVAGVALQVYQANTSAYGGAASAIAGDSATTTASGNFNLNTGNCTAGSELFVVGTGGTPIGGSQNANLALMAALGPCGGSVASSFIEINELTTVATVYALAGFMTGPTNIGAPASNSVGLTNAFAAVNKVVDIANGTVSGPTLPTNAILPTLEISALGNILQNCVNSAGGSAGDTTDGLTNGTPCGKLFFLTKTGSVTPTNTIMATLLLAQNPGLPLGAGSNPSYVARLNDVQSATPAFMPTLSVNSPPAAWTIAINYTGGGLSTPQSIATDANGNVWVTNPGNNSLTQLANTGAAISPTAGFTAGSLSTPYGIALDTSGNAWVTNSGNNTLSKVAPSGTSALVYSNNGLNSPKGVAIDGSGNVWVANSGVNSVSTFSPAGAAVGTFTGGGITTPTSIAVSPK